METEPSSPSSSSPSTRTTTTTTTTAAAVAVAITNSNRGGNAPPNEIPVEIVTDEEMALIEAAMSSARALLPPLSSCTSSRVALFSALPHAATSVQRNRWSSSSSTPPLSQRASSSDIEESSVCLSRAKSPLQQFRRRRALSVTDITATEWCEKQMEFVLLHGKPEKTEAMKAGSNRHTELEEEVVEKVEVVIKSVEESWAVKFMNFIFGANQLLFDGLTRELPVLGIIEGIWMVGMIDEIRIPINEAVQNPLLVDTKTRYKATLPSEAQKRNARFQLMCYKYMWDQVVTDSFPTSDFFNYFELDPQYILSKDVKQYSARLGLQAKTLEDVVMYFRNTCCLLTPSQEKLLLRYELQADRSLLEEYYFAFDDGWFKGQILDCLKFWSGEREASFVSENDRWKCRFCKFAGICPIIATPSNSSVENRKQD